MIGRIFLWFYCLDIPHAVGVILVAVLMFLAMRKRWERLPLWKPAMGLLFLCFLGVILLGTLSRRESTVDAVPQLIPFYSYYLVAQGGNPELYRANFMNAALFFPAGLVGCELVSRRRKHSFWIFLLLLMLSIGIEYCQYRFSLGLVETDDVIHNTLGALLGILSGSLSRNDRKKL